MSRFGLRSKADGVKMTGDDKPLTGGKKSSPEKAAATPAPRKINTTGKKKTATASKQFADLAALTSLNCTSTTSAGMPISIICSLPLSRLTGIIEKINATNAASANSKSAAAEAGTAHESDATTEDGSFKEPEQQQQQPLEAIDTPAQIVKVLCLYCDKKFSSLKLQLKHVEKFHVQPSDRRSSGRNSQSNETSTPSKDSRSAGGDTKPPRNAYPGCTFCNKTSGQQMAGPIHNLENLFMHLTDQHADKYHGCKMCMVRFQSVGKLAKHMQSTHNAPLRMRHDDAARLDAADADDAFDKVAASGATDGSKTAKTRLQKSQKSTAAALPNPQQPQHNTSSCNSSSSSSSSSCSSSLMAGSTTTPSPPNLLNDESLTIMGAEETILSRLGLTQNRLPNKRKGVRQRRESSAAASSSNLLPSPLGLKSEQATASLASSLKLRQKSAKSAVATTSDSDVVFRVPTRTEVLSCAFDEDFYKDVIANVRTNLLYHLDGKLSPSPSDKGGREDEAAVAATTNSLLKYPALPQIRSSLVRSPPRQADGGGSSELHAATSLTTSTAFPTLLTAEQYGGDALKIRRPHTKHSWKWKWDSVKKFKIISEGGKMIKKMKQPMASGLRDLSKLDMWTQLTMRQKHEQYAQQHGPEAADLLAGGSSVDLQASAAATSSTSLLLSREDKQRLTQQLNFILDMRLLPNITLEQNEQTCIKEEHGVRGTSLEAAGGHRSDLSAASGDCDFLSMLHLRPHNGAQASGSPLVLSGEWARPRCYLCMCCGAKFDKLKSLEEHKIFRHSNILSTHYELVGRELLSGNLMQHLFLPKRALARYTNSSNELLERSPRSKYPARKSHFNVPPSSTSTTVEDESSDSTQSLPHTIRPSYGMAVVKNGSVGGGGAAVAAASSADAEFEGELKASATDTPQPTTSPTHSLQSSSSSFTTPVKRQPTPAERAELTPPPLMATSCTKCSRKCNGMMELYRHLLDCSGDYIWSMAKKRKYRYYCGSKRRRPCNKHHFAEYRRKRMAEMKAAPAGESPAEADESNSPASNSNAKPKNSSPRQRPSDAESIKKMLENLPPKRVCKKIFPTLTKAKKARKSKLMAKHQLYKTQVLRKTRSRQISQAAALLLSKKKSNATATAASTSGRNQALESSLTRRATRKSTAPSSTKDKGDAKAESTAKKKAAATAEVNGVPQKGDSPKRESNMCHNDSASTKQSKGAAKRQLAAPAQKPQVSENAATSVAATKSSTADEKKPQAAAEKQEPLEKKPNSPKSSSEGTPPKSNPPAVKSPEASGPPKVVSNPPASAGDQVNATKKRSKKINDCIARLTGKLEEKLKTGQSAGGAAAAASSAPANTPKDCAILEVETPKELAATQPQPSKQPEQPPPQLQPQKSTPQTTPPEKKTPKRKAISRRFIKPPVELNAFGDPEEVPTEKIAATKDATPLPTATLAALVAAPPPTTTAAASLSQSSTIAPTITTASITSTTTATTISIPTTLVSMTLTTPTVPVTLATAPTTTIQTTPKTTTTLPLPLPSMLPLPLNESVPPISKPTKSFEPIVANHIAASAARNTKLVVAPPQLTQQQQLQPPPQLILNAGLNALPAAQPPPSSEQKVPFFRAGDEKILLLNANQNVLLPPPTNQVPIIVAPVATASVQPPFNATMPNASTKVTTELPAAAVAVPLASQPPPAPVNSMPKMQAFKPAAASCIPTATVPLHDVNAVKLLAALPPLPPPAQQSAGQTLMPLMPTSPALSVMMAVAAPPPQQLAPPPLQQQPIAPPPQQQQLAAPPQQQQLAPPQQQQQQLPLPVQQQQLPPPPSQQQQPSVFPLLPPTVLLSHVPSVPVASVAPQPFNIEPLNLSNTKNGQKSGDALCGLRPGIPARRKTICGFEFPHEMPFNDMEPLDLSYKAKRPPMANEVVPPPIVFHPNNTTQAHALLSIPQQQAQGVLAPTQPQALIGQTQPQALLGPSHQQQQPQALMAPQQQAHLQQTVTVQQQQQLLAPLTSQQQQTHSSQPNPMNSGDLPSIGGGAISPKPLPLAVTCDAATNKQFYSNLDLLKIPQVRNPTLMPPANDLSTVTAKSVSPAKKRTNAKELTPIISPVPPVAIAGVSATITSAPPPPPPAPIKAAASQPTANKGGSGGGKGKPIPKMDEEVANHIDDAINSVINAVKASLEEESAERAAQTPANLPELAASSNLSTEANPIPKIMLNAPVAAPAIFVAAPLETQAPPVKMTGPQRRMMRSKTLDCRPACLALPLLETPLVAVVAEPLKDVSPQLPVVQQPPKEAALKPNDNNNVEVPSQPPCVKTEPDLDRETQSKATPEVEENKEEPREPLPAPPPQVAQPPPLSEPLPSLPVGVTPVETVKEKEVLPKGRKEPAKGRKEKTPAPETLKAVEAPAREEPRNEVEEPQVQKPPALKESQAKEETSAKGVEESTATNNNKKPEERGEPAAAASVEPPIDFNAVAATDPKKKQRRRRKNELAAIVADQLLESFKIDKARRDNLKKLENLAYEKSEDLLLTGMLLMSSTKRNASSGVGAYNTDGNGNVDRGESNSKTARKTAEDKERPPTKGQEPEASVEKVPDVRRSKRRQCRRKGGNLIDNENISKLKSSLESFSIGIEKQLSEFEAKNSAGGGANTKEAGSEASGAAGKQSTAAAAPVVLKPSILRPSILSASMEQSPQPNKVVDPKTVVSSRDPRLNKNIHKDAAEPPGEMLTRTRLRSLNEKNLEELRDFEEDNYLTEIAKNVNEKIMSAENEEFMFANDGFEMAAELQNDDSNSKYYRPPTSMSVRSAPNFDERSNYGSICDENTNTEVMDMDLDDELSVYTSYSQDIGRGRRRRRRRRSILLKRKPKKRPNADGPTETFECMLCKKTFFTATSLNKHNMTLAHVSKVSEQEYLQSKSMSAMDMRAFQRHTRIDKLPYAKKGAGAGAQLNGLEASRALSRSTPALHKLDLQRGDEEEKEKALDVTVSQAAENKASDKANSQRLNLNPDERLFFECCTILKGASNTTTTHVANSDTGTLSHTQKERPPEGIVPKPVPLKRSISETATELVADRDTVFKPVPAKIVQPTPFRGAAPPMAKQHCIAQQPNVTSNTNLYASNYSAISQFSGVTNTTTSRFKTKAAMKGFDNIHVDLTTTTIQQEYETKSTTVCKLTELAEIALEQDKPVAPLPPSSVSPDYHHQPTTIPTQASDKYSSKQLTTTHGYVSLSLTDNHPKNPETQSSTSSKTIMHSSKLKAAVQQHNNNSAPSKIIIPERPFKNIGLEEKESITFQKPKTSSLNLALTANDDNSVSTVSYSDRDDFDFGLLSCDEENSIKTSNEKTINRNSSDSSSSSRATAKTFENKSLIMGRIFKNASSKGKPVVATAAPKPKSVAMQKDCVHAAAMAPPPKADINQLFDELRGDAGAAIGAAAIHPETPMQAPVLGPAVAPIAPIPIPAIPEPVASGSARTPQGDGFLHMEGNLPTAEASFSGTKHKAAQLPMTKLTKTQTPEQLPVEPVTVAGRGRPRKDTASRAKKPTSATKKKATANNKDNKDITKLQSELGMSPAEIEKLIDEGQRKSKRRCATNRPKKLVEMWSSDEYEEFLSTKDIIALIEEKEKREQRKKRKNSLSKDGDDRDALFAPETQHTANKKRSARAVSVANKREPAASEEFESCEKKSKRQSKSPDRSGTVETVHLYKQAGEVTPAKKATKKKSGGKGETSTPARSRRVGETRGKTPHPELPQTSDPNREVDGPEKTSRPEPQRAKEPSRSKTPRPEPQKVWEPSRSKTPRPEPSRSKTPRPETLKNPEPLKGPEPSHSKTPWPETHRAAEPFRSKTPRPEQPKGVERLRPLDPELAAQRENVYDKKPLSSYKEQEYDFVPDYEEQAHRPRRSKVKTSKKSEAEPMPPTTLHPNMNGQITKDIPRPGSPAREQSVAKEGSKNTLTSAMPTKKPNKGKRKSAANQSSPRKKRLASEKLYYWSSSSDEEFGRVNNQSADEFESREPHQQHGWIVGDSHKKIVTLLAIAKGNKKPKKSGKKKRKSLK